MELLRFCLVIGLFSPVFLTDVHEKEDNSGCNVEEISNCIGESHSDLGTAIVPYLTDTELNQICSEWDQAEPCLYAVTEACEASNTTDPKIKVLVNQRIEEITKGRSYMCEQSKRNTYEKDVRPCYETNKETLDADSTNCLHEYDNATWYLNGSDTSNTYKFCSAAQTYLKCQSEAMEKTCGDSAASWTKGYHSNLWSSHMESIKCSAEERMEGGAIMIVTLCSAGIVYSLFFVALGFIRDSDKFKCTGLKKHTRPGYQYRLQSQDSR